VKDQFPYGREHDFLDSCEPFHVNASIILSVFSIHTLVDASKCKKVPFLVLPSLTVVTEQQTEVTKIIRGKLKIGW
jgi:hypothetical protein